MPTTFGVTYLTVRADVVPFFDEFSTVSNPTAATVARWIDEEAADLAGQLLLEAITASSITDTASNPYLWCRKTLTLMVGARVLKISSSQYPELARAMEEELDRRFESLDVGGGAALGDESLSTSSSDPDGPTDHIQEYGLDFGTPSEDASSVEPVLRKDDEL